MSSVQKFPYEYPDGEECAGKIYRSTRIGTFLGLFIASQDAILKRYSMKGFGNKFYRYMSLFGPFFMSGFAYGSVVCLSANMRKKNDHYNHFAAGSISALIVGLRFTNFPVKLAILGGIIGIFRKELQMTNFHFFAKHETYEEYFKSLPFGRECDKIMYVRKRTESD